MWPLFSESVGSSFRYRNLLARSRNVIALHQLCLWSCKANFCTFIHSETTCPCDNFLYERDLTHWGRDSMAAISQTTVSNAICWMKIIEFQLKFHWRLFLRIQLTIIQHCFRYWLGAFQATSHYLNQWWLVYWRIYASLGLNELRHVRTCLHALAAGPHMA